MSPPDSAGISPVTLAANAFVDSHRAEAEALGDRLAALTGDPVRFERELEDGLHALADPLVPDGIRAVTPGLGPVIGVRLPLLSSAHRRFVRGTRQVPEARIRDCIEPLLGHQMAEVQWFGMWSFERLLAAEPTRTWSLIRRAARAAHEWITVDTLAHPCGAGILRDPARWSELERLAGSESRWERRLVGSTVATMPFVKLPGARGPEVVRRGLAMAGRLMGDPEPDVQKALSWALRNLAALDGPAVVALVDAGAEIARSAGDGNRAWVIRDCLSKLPASDAARLRAELQGVRRGPRGSSALAAARVSPAPSTNQTRPPSAVPTRSSAT